LRAPGSRRTDSKEMITSEMRNMKDSYRFKENRIKRMGRENRDAGEETRLLEYVI